LKARLYVFLLFLRRGLSPREKERNEHTVASEYLNAVQEKKGIKRFRDSKSSHREQNPCSSMKFTG